MVGHLCKGFHHGDLEGGLFYWLAACFKRTRASNTAVIGTGLKQIAVHIVVMLPYFPEDKRHIFLCEILQKFIRSGTLAAENFQAPLHSF